MIEGVFDARTLANMNVALDRVCERAARGEEHAVRKRVAMQIIKCARSGKTTLSDLTAAGQRGLIKALPTLRRDPPSLEKPMTTDFADAEALRLVKAFMKIENPQARRIIITIVEAAARGATVRIEELAASDTLSELRSQLEDQGIDS